MSRLAEAVREAAAVGARVQVEGERVKVRRADGVPLGLVERLRPLKPDILNLHREHGDRLAHYSGRYGPDIGARMAFNVTATEWHLRHMAPPSQTSCAGCGERLDAGVPAGSKLPDGAMVHASDRCLIAYGERWRTAAADALARLGIARPKGWEP